MKHPKGQSSPPKLKSFKDLKLFVKRFLKENLLGLPKDKVFEVRPEGLNPPRVKLFLPFYSEGNLLRAHQVDILLSELYNLGISTKLFYEDDWVEAMEDETFSPGSQ